MRSIAFDTSTLVLLAKIDLLRIVTRQVRVHVPLAVKRESTAKPDLADAQYIQHLITEGSLHVEMNVSSRLCDRLLREFRLGAGEAACVAVAVERHWGVATDDRQAMKACKVLGMVCVPALAWLLHSAKERWVSAALALAKLEVLKPYGWYEPALIERVRQELKGVAS
jgi:predicted nucleic acid-binding protein